MMAGYLGKAKVVSPRSGRGSKRRCDAGTWLMSGRSLGDEDDDDDDDVIQAAGTYMLTAGRTLPGRQALHR